MVVAGGGRGGESVNSVLWFRLLGLAEGGRHDGLSGDFDLSPVVLSSMLAPVPPPEAIGLLGSRAGGGS